MKDLLIRSLTGILFVAILVGAIMWDKLAVASLFFIISLIGLNEFFALMIKNGFNPKKSITTAIGAVIYFIISLYSFDQYSFKFLLFIFPLLVLLVVIEIFRKNETPISNIAFSIMGILYVVIPFAILNFFAYESTYSDVINIEDGQHNYWLLLGFFLLQWSNDTGAYLIGSSLGKHKMTPEISPNKTWEGAIGGLVMSLLVAFVISYFTYSSLFHWLAISTIVVIFGTIGDLTESRIKRTCGVKDSGRIMPGHGGILDRFDGVLFSAPFVLAYLHIFNLFSL
jgi:phosphatidate cytidylyltransferase